MQFQRSSQLWPFFFDLGLELNYPKKGYFKGNNQIIIEFSRVHTNNKLIPLYFSSRLQKVEGNNKKEIESSHIFKYEKIFSNNERDDYRVTMDYNEKGVYELLIFAKEENSNNQKFVSTITTMIELENTNK